MNYVRVPKTFKYFSPDLFIFPQQRGRCPDNLAEARKHWGAAAPMRTSCVFLSFLGGGERCTEEVSSGSEIVIISWDLTGLSFYHSPFCDWRIRMAAITLTGKLLQWKCHSWSLATLSFHSGVLPKTLWVRSQKLLFSPEMTQVIYQYSGLGQ